MAVLWGNIGSLLHNISYHLVSINCVPGNILNILESLTHLVLSTTDEETKAQRDQVTCLRLFNELNWNPSNLLPEFNALSFYALLPVLEYCIGYWEKGAIH